MTRIFLNGLGASAGAGLTYLYNVVPCLSAANVKTTLALQPALREQFKKFPHIYVPEFPVPAGTAQRFWFEQRNLPELIRKSGAEVLISAGNFALRKSPVPQVLLSGNSLYTSRDFDRDLKNRREYGMWIDTRVKAVLARKSVHWADFTIAPSQAYADDLSRWTGREVRAVHHGFNFELFFRNSAPLPDSIQRKLGHSRGRVKLLFVSHYNYYRNFETLFRAVAIVRKRTDLKLYLTCGLDPGTNPGNYRTDTAAELIQELGIRDQIVELGAIPYHLLHHIYRACDIYVTPAYTETFAHPLVEAMASGLPVVASDLRVHREICPTALFFDKFSPQELADTVLQLANSPELVKELVARGKIRAKDFSWQRHVHSLLQIPMRMKACSDAA